MKFDNFFCELERRNVYKVAVAYAVVGWLVIQISWTVLRRSALGCVVAHHGIGR
jgi:hypothetical protein